VYAPHVEVREAPPAPGTREITFGEALNEALHAELARDGRVFVMGEDVGLIGESVARTHRLVIAHEAVKRGGFGAEIAALVAEKALDELDAPIVRVGARSAPMPYNDALERATIPSQEDIEAAVRSLL
jgi:pyruvate/2-oxoglutarate/acetoin dehydrogenase E1 component